jgi:periplasmic mercuric ion binding protein
MASRPTYLNPLTVTLHERGEIMRIIRSTIVLSVGLLLAAAVQARAETKIELKGVHLCCPGCVKAAATILKGVEGAQGKCDIKTKTITITASDDKTAQAALDALAAGGFHGETGNDELKIKDDSGAGAGKVKSVSVTGAHNCCGACCKAIKQTVKKVDGVTADTAKPKAESFEVTGDFDVAELVKALNAAGFHVKVQK